MNLIDNEVNEKKIQNTKNIKIIGVILIVLIIVAIGLIMLLSHIRSKEFKYFLDDKIQNITSDLFYTEEDGELYISIRDLSTILQANSIVAEYNNGTYNKYNEDNTECYVKQQYEVAGYESNSKKMYKYILEDNTYEYFELDKPVKDIHGKLYTTVKGIEIGFNITTNYIESSNSLTMITLDKLVEKYAKQLKNNVINSKEMSFSNKKALKYGFVIVSNNNENNKNSKTEYGVKKIVNSEKGLGYENDDVIGTKYAKLKFIEDMQDFIVTTSDNKQGVISVSRNKKNIEPKYQELKKISDNLNLYLIKNEKEKYGVFDREKQEEIIYPEYDSIGIDIKQFKNEEIENQYVLYDNCIPCKKADNGIYKWELIDINGTKLIDQQFDGIGYIKGTSKNAKGDNLLLIPEIESIIVNKDSMYGIINSTGRLLVKINMQQIYSETTAGKITYYMVYNDQSFDVLETLKKANIDNITDKTELENTKESSTNENN